MKDLIAELFRRAADRLDPPEPSTDIVSEPLTWPDTSLYWPLTSGHSQCLACGAWFQGAHVCHTTQPTTTSPLPFPSSITYTSASGTTG